MSMKEVKPQANAKLTEEELYTEDSIWANVARSNAFFVFCMSAVLLNAIWLMVDVDNNPSPTVAGAPLQFQITEHAFCVIFVSELMIRFLAFRRARDWVKDPWFRFDLALVVLMVTETWILPLILLMYTGQNSSSDNLSTFSVLRLARLLRLSRMTRLLRCVPEVMTLLKGIATAFRSVFFTLCLLGILLYVFGILFRTEVEGNEKLSGLYFKSVTHSMWSLLIYGVFMDSVGTMLRDVEEYSGKYLTTMLIIFVFLSSYTVMNMLIGILCEVVTGISKQEEEKAEITYLKRVFMDILECYDKDGDENIGEQEFELLMQNPEVRETLTKFGTDARGLVTLSEVLFQENTSGSAKGSMGFEELLNVVLRLRGEHTSRVTDIVELREYMRHRLDRVEGELRAGQKELGERLLSQRTTGLASPCGLVVVSLTLPGGRTKVRRHAARTTVAQLLDQLTLEHGRLVVLDGLGVELGTELMLGDLAAAYELVKGSLALTLAHG